MSLEENKVLDGVGRDAEIVTNSSGGKQSKTPMALHLVDPFFLREIIGVYNTLTFSKNYGVAKAINRIALYMENENIDYLFDAISSIEEDVLQRLVRIAKVLQIGADRYEPNNWRLIPQESHINHALIHLVAHLMGDTQDDHIDHALCRLMMAMSTSKSPNFSYTDYILPKGEDAKLDEAHELLMPDCEHKCFPFPICGYKYECHYKEEQ